VLETGDVLEIGEDSAEIVDCVSEDYVFVDGHAVGDVGQTILDERMLLSKNGFLVAVVAVDKYSNSVVGKPQIITRGFVYQAEAEDLFEMMRGEITHVIERGGTRSELTEQLRRALTRLAFEETGRHPIVVPVITKI